MKKDGSQQQKAAPVPDRAESVYPIGLLSRYIGSEIEVHYVDAGLPQIVHAALASQPNSMFFYLSLYGVDMNIVYWNKAHSEGRISAVKMIKAGGEIIYCNDEVFFETSRAVRLDRRAPFKGPVRRMTREYLSGAFG